MKKRYFKSRKPKERQQIPADVAATLRDFIAKTWIVIGSLRKKREYDTKNNPWNPCLRAQQNYVAWCRNHQVNPKCWDNFIYYFGVESLFAEPIGSISTVSMPHGISIATMELEIATGSAGFLGFYDKLIKQESLEKYEDFWHVVFTAKNAEGVNFKKKLIITAKSFSMDGKPVRPQWTVSYQNKSSWISPRHRSQTTIEYLEDFHPTKSNYGAWWLPVMASLTPGEPLNRELQVQVQPLTHRARHEIRNSLYDDDY
jgi:hypothetical protein